ncbi:glutamine--fructose-6-phosphate transaminase [Sphingomonas laterariae]|uniref:Glutamine--fructose-6-phosphate transaminase n=1 Tax=Edaphosphingomonas laterariae TaxID=861865 RepID=A0A239ELL4_9SPHN|nr:SIS domain-containing protein [Sphingomonas laterariae]SNS44774.1 glutamine--fructose-6-phosphate transaminase [Sphingomonas laterariae]
MMNPESTLMFAEAAEAASVVTRQRAANAARLAELVETLRARPPRAVITCARGSSDHAATFAKYLIETRLGLLVSSAAPSVASVYGAEQRLADVLAIAISQSGKSPDLLATVDAAQKAGAQTLALVNVADSPLAGMVDHTLPLHAGPERSVAATKSYIATLAGLVDLVQALAGDDELGRALDAAPTLLRQAWDADWSPLVDTLADARGLFVVGRGLGLGVAQEAALKFKETCGLHAEAFSAAEVKHGPMALVGPGFPLLILRQSDETGEGVDDLAAEMAARGGPVLIAGGEAKGAIRLPTVAGHPVIEPMLQIQSFYRAVNALSVRRGFNPDQPPHLAKVTETL